MTYRRLASALVLVLLATACGTRVPAAERQALSAGGSAADGTGSSADEFAGESGLGSDGTSALGGSSLDGATGGADGGSGPSSGTAGRSAGGSSGGSASVPADSGGTGPGVTETEILLGVAFATNGGEVNKTIGAEEASSTDTKKATQLLIDDVNRRGGIHGRKIKPVWHEIDALSGRTYEQWGQEMCATWTEDNDVFAALGAPYETLRQCFAKAGKPLSYTSLSSSSELTFSKYPLYLEPGNLNLSRIGRLTVNSLADRNFFNAESKIGIIAFDDPEGRHSVDKAMVPALGARGLKATDIRFVPPPQSATDVSGLSAAISSAVLRFNTAGITHVMILDTAAVATLLFMQEAESQGYRPRYGLNTQNGNTVLAGILDGSGAKAQLNNSLSVGWAPSLDLSEQDDPNDKANAARKRCMKILTDGGLTSFTSRNAMGQALITCEEMWFFEAAAKAAGPNLNARSFLTGAESLQTVWESPLTLGNKLGPGRHDGVARAADMAYVPSCNCFRYTTQPYDLKN